MKKFKIVSAIGLLIGLTASLGFSLEGSKVVSNVVPQSFADNSSDVKNSTLFIWMGSGAWLPPGSTTAITGCSETRSYIRTEDKKLQAAFLTFWTTGKIITLTVDNSKIAKDGGCQIVSVRAD